MLERNVYYLTEFNFDPGQSYCLNQRYLALSLCKRRLETGGEVEQHITEHNTQKKTHHTKKNTSHIKNSIKHTKKQHITHKKTNT